MNFKELLFKAIEKAVNNYVETGNIGKNEVSLIQLYASLYEVTSGILDAISGKAKEQFESIPFKVED